MKLIDAVRKIHSTPYIAVVLSDNEDLKYISDAILRRCSSSDYCVRAVYDSMLDAHLATLCIPKKFYSIEGLVSWYQASKFEYLIDGFENVEVYIPDLYNIADGRCYSDYMYEGNITRELIFKYATTYTSKDILKDVRVVYESIIILQREVRNE